MDRREFLRRGVAAGAAVGGMGVVLGEEKEEKKNGTGSGTGSGTGTGEERKPAEGTPKHLEAARRLRSRIKLSCAAYSYRQLLEKEKAMTMEGFISRCAEMGLDGAELTSYYLYRTDPASLNALKRQAFLLGLDINGTAVGNDFCKPAGPERDREIRQVKEWTERAAILGAMTVRIFAGNAPRGEPEEAARARAVEAIRECCEHAGRHGVILALENHGGITSTAEQLLAICKEVDSPWFGVNLDTGNFHTEDPYRDLALAAPHAVTVQVKVEISRRGKPAEAADLSRILEILRGVNYRGWLVLEYEAKEDPVIAVPGHVARLKELLAQG